VLHIRGELDLSRARETEAALTEFAEASEAGLLIDLRECAFIDSSGLRSLLMGHRALMMRNGDPDDKRDRLGAGDANPPEEGTRLSILVAPDSQVSRLLDLVGLESHFRVTQDRDEALRLLEKN
jgi:anti-anti-sigma regulatory factor